MVFYTSKLLVLSNTISSSAIDLETSNTRQILVGTQDWLTIFHPKKNMLTNCHQAVASDSSATYTQDMKQWPHPSNGFTASIVENKSFLTAK